MEASTGLVPLREADAKCAMVRRADVQMAGVNIEWLNMEPTTGRRGCTEGMSPGPISRTTHDDQ
jgi:hypothetical protein